MYLLIDNYDSFTYNLYHYFLELGAKIEVYRNDKITTKDILKKKYKGIVLSPGPCTPNEAGICLELIKEISKVNIPTLGVCLGHQAIAECFGAKLKNLEDVMHGVSSEIIFTKEESIFKNIPNQIQVGHYHSWVIDEKTLPICFEVTSKNEDGIIMSIRHKEYDLKGVQFHPESILTEYGLLMIKNWIQS